MVCRRRCGAALLLVVLGLCGFASFHSLSSSDACACSPSTATGEAGEGCERRAGTGGRGVSNVPKAAMAMLWPRMMGLLGARFGAGAAQDR